MKRGTLYPFLLGAALVAVPLRPIDAASPTPPSGHVANSGSLTGFFVVPGNQQPKKRYFLYTVAPGQTVADTVAIVNPATTPLTVSLSASDAINSPGGLSVTFVEDPRRQREIGNWFHIRNTTVTVAPKTALLVPVTLQVSPSARPGQYEGSVSATNLQGGSVTQGRATINVRGRVRCTILLRVIGQGSAGLRIDKVGALYRAQHNLLTVTFKNTGTVFANPVTAVMTFRDIAHPDKSYTLRRYIGLVLGGNAATAIFDLNRFVPVGAYQARIQLTYRAKLTPASAPNYLHATWNGRVVVPKQ